MATEKPSETVRLDVELKLPVATVRLRIPAPAGPASMRQLLPVLRSLTNQMVEKAVGVVEGEGCHVSCRKGCGACCRHLVPVVEAEARFLLAFVSELPEPRRGVVLARFAEARRRLVGSGLLPRVENREGLASKERQTLGLDYFALGIPCPFLEEEACSIHDVRPMSCRQYLVTSPAERCANPATEQLDVVSLPASVWDAVAAVDKDPSRPDRLPWQPLVLALDWAREHLEEPPARLGPHLLAAVLEEVARRAAAEEEGGPT